MISKKIIVVTSITTVVLFTSVLCGEQKKNKTVIKTNNEDTAAMVFVDSFKVRSLRDIRFEPTAQRLKHGQYLADGLLQCFTCHSPRQWNVPGAPPIDSLKGSGGVVINEDSVMRIIAPNITSDKETGAGNWTDDMLSRAIREGVGHDGRVLNWVMPHFIFRNLCDEDLASVIVYLRSLPPIHKAVPPTKMYPEERSGLEKAVQPIVKPVPAPDLSDNIKRGKYLVMLGECIGCHTSHSEYNPGLNGGGNDIQRFGLRAFSANITADSSGMAYGDQAFIFTIRTGKGGTLSPIMPWIAYKNMNDEDLRSVYAYLKTLPHAEHYVTNNQPFSHCAICGLVHGSGSENKRTIPKGIKIDPDSYDKYVGKYFSSERGSTYIIFKKRNKLYGKTWDKGPEAPLVAKSELDFVAPGWVLPISFVKDADGQINSLKEATDYGGVFTRVK